MSLHHRAVIKAYNTGDVFVRETTDIGFPWGTKWEDKPAIADEVARLRKRYDVVKVDVRDAG